MIQKKDKLRSSFDALRNFEFGSGIALDSNHFLKTARNRTPVAVYLIVTGKAE
jgi:hypothetical protein